MRGKWVRLNDIFCVFYMIEVVVKSHNQFYYDICIHHDYLNVLKFNRINSWLVKMKSISFVAFLNMYISFTIKPGYLYTSNRQFIFTRFRLKLLNPLSILKNWPCSMSTRSE